MEGYDSVGNASAHQGSRVLFGSQDQRCSLHELSSIAAFFPLRLDDPYEGRLRLEPLDRRQWVTTQNPPTHDPQFNLRYRVKFREADHLDQNYFSTAIEAQ